MRRPEDLQYFEGILTQESIAADGSVGTREIHGSTAMPREEGHDPMLVAGTKRKRRNRLALPRPKAPLPPQSARTPTQSSEHGRALQAFDLNRRDSICRPVLTDCSSTTTVAEREQHTLGKGSLASGASTNRPTAVDASTDRCEYAEAATPATGWTASCERSPSPAAFEEKSKPSPPITPPAGPSNDGARDDTTAVAVSSRAGCVTSQLRQQEYGPLCTAPPCERPINDVLDPGDARCIGAESRPSAACATPRTHVGIESSLDTGYQPRYETDDISVKPTGRPLLGDAEQVPGNGGRRPNADLSLTSSATRDGVQHEVLPRRPQGLDNDGACLSDGDDRHSPTGSLGLGRRGGEVDAPSARQEGEQLVKKRASLGRSEQRCPVCGSGVWGLSVGARQTAKTAWRSVRAAHPADKTVAFREVKLRPARVHINSCLDEALASRNADDRIPYEAPECARELPPHNSSGSSASASRRSSTGTAKEPKTEFQADVQMAKALSRSLVTAAPPATEDKREESEEVLLTNPAAFKAKERKLLATLRDLDVKMERLRKDRENALKKLAAHRALGARRDVDSAADIRQNSGLARSAAEVVDCLFAGTDDARDAQEHPQRPFPEGEPCRREGTRGGPSAALPKTCEEAGARAEARATSASDGTCPELSGEGETVAFVSNTGNNDLVAGEVPLLRRRSSGGAPGRRCSASSSTAASAAAGGSVARGPSFWSIAQDADELSQSKFVTGVFADVRAERTAAAARSEARRSDRSGRAAPVTAEAYGDASLFNRRRPRIDDGSRASESAASGRAGGSIASALSAVTSSLSSPSDAVEKRAGKGDDRAADGSEGREQGAGRGAAADDAIDLLSQTLSGACAARVRGERRSAETRPSHGAATTRAAGSVAAKHIARAPVAAVSEHFPDWEENVHFVFEQGVPELRNALESIGAALSEEQSKAAMRILGADRRREGDSSPADEPAGVGRSAKAEALLFFQGVLLEALAMKGTARLPSRDRSASNGNGDGQAAGRTTGDQGSSEHDCSVDERRGPNAEKYSDEASGEGTVAAVEYGYDSSRDDCIGAPQEEEFYDPGAGLGGTPGFALAPGGDATRKAAPGRRDTRESTGAGADDESCDEIASRPAEEYSISEKGSQSPGAVVLSGDSYCSAIITFDLTNSETRKESAGHALGAGDASKGHDQDADASGTLEASGEAGGGERSDGGEDTDLEDGCHDFRKDLEANLHWDDGDDFPSFPSPCDDFQRHLALSPPRTPPEALPQPTRALPRCESRDHQRDPGAHDKADVEEAAACAPDAGRDAAGTLPRARPGREGEPLPLVLAELATADTQGAPATSRAARMSFTQQDPLRLPSDSMRVPPARSWSPPVSSRLAVSRVEDGRTRSRAAVAGAVEAAAAVAPAAAPSSSSAEDTEKQDSAMPSFGQMTVPELAGMMSVYGLKKKPKREMVQRLESIWKALHPAAEGESEEIAPAGTSTEALPGTCVDPRHGATRLERQMEAIARTSQAAAAAARRPPSSVPDGASSIDLDTGTGEAAGQLKHSRPAQSLDDDGKSALGDRIRAVLTGHPQLHEDILLLKTVELSATQALLKGKGVKCSKRDLATYLDERGITFVDRGPGDKARAARKRKRGAAGRAAGGVSRSQG